MIDNDHTNPLKLLFFCGERSRWGYSHLMPLLSESRLRIVGVILATEARWKIFQEVLTQEKTTFSTRTSAMKAFLRALTKKKGHHRTKAALKLLSEHRIPVQFCDDANSIESIESFREYGVDFVLCAAFPQIFKTSLLSICPDRFFNSHPSLLPRCRGAHPVFWAIATGETKSGATIHYMTKDVDKGDIVAQVAVDMLPNETYSELYTKLINVIPNLTSEFVMYLTSPNSRALPQNETQATYFRNDRRIHRRIFWSEMTAVQVFNLVRACRGKAYCWHNNKKLLVGETEVSDKNVNLTNGLSVPPGTIVGIRDKMPVVAARSQFVVLKNVSSPVFRKVKFETGQILQ